MTSTKSGSEKNSIVFEEQWPKMQPIVVKLLQQESVNRSEWQDLFYTVHQVCLWDEKAAGKIYKALQENIEDFIRQVQKRVCAHIEDQALLKAYITEWRKFFEQCSYLPLPFSQVELSLNNYNTTTPTSGRKMRNDDSDVRKLMLDSWNNQIFSNIKARLQASAMKLVGAERNGEAFDSQLVIGVRESYVNLCSDPEDKLRIYRENFEKAYIDATESFYRVKSSEELNLNGVQNYMKYAYTKLKEEEARAQKYLETQTSVDKLMASSVHVLVSLYKEQILNESPEMIKWNQTEKLQLMYKLMDRVPDGINALMKDLEDHIISAGLEDMKANAQIITQDSEKYIERLLELFKRFSLLVKTVFLDDPRFLTSRDKAFKIIVNDTCIFKLELPLKPGLIKTSPESRCPELLANYCDLLLRRTPLSKRLTSDEIEARLKDVLLVLKYVQNKDVFMRYHKAHLTRRLILDTSVDNDKEESMVEWLREVGMPADFVNKLGRMFQDIKVSADLNQQFKEQYRVSKGPVADSINIKILNAGAWARGSERINVSLPVELEDYIPEVEDFYRTMHNGRKLQWYHHMANGTITFSNAVGKFDLDVTTFQMAVLFAWNHRPKERITYENLKLATELPDPELRKTLWSLVAFPKVKKQLLLYEPEVQNPKDFQDDTVFWVNQEFSVIKNNRVQRRGKISLIGRLQLSTERSREEDNEGIVQLRVLRVQEAIIKILKMRKRVSNLQLHNELIDILKNMFLPSKKMIKEQIEWLMENKYMRRDDKDINIFVYMA